MYTWLCRCEEKTLVGNLGTPSLVGAATRNTAPYIQYIYTQYMYIYISRVRLMNYCHCTNHFPNGMRIRQGLWLCRLWWVVLSWARIRGARARFEMLTLEIAGRGFLFYHALLLLLYFMRLLILSYTLLRRSSQIQASVWDRFTRRQVLCERADHFH
jgi:hypothetical protein